MIHRRLYIIWKRLSRLEHQLRLIRVGWAWKFYAVNWFFFLSGRSNRTDIEPPSRFSYSVCTRFNNSDQYAPRPLLIRRKKSIEIEVFLREVNAFCAGVCARQSMRNRVCTRADDAYSVGLNERKMLFMMAIYAIFLSSDAYLRKCTPITRHSPPMMQE